MTEILTVANMRKSDAAAIAGGIPGRELMRRAGRGIFESVSWEGPVGILCGAGNNAGDGYVLALLLKEAGISCELILLSDHFSEDGRYYFDQCRAEGIPFFSLEAGRDLKAFATLVDCIFGTGFHGTVTGVYREAVEKINTSGARVISVDINSGLNGDSGYAECCVKSDLTISVGGFQPGHFLSMAGDVMKEKINIDIGIRPVDPPILKIGPEDLGCVFPERRHLSNKGTWGYMALIGGSLKYGGAIRLAAMANAAMRSGTGVVKAALPASLCPALMPLILETTIFPLSDRDGQILFRREEAEELIGNIRSAAFGMGIGTNEGAGEMLRYLLSHFGGRLLVDADGLNLMAGMDRKTVREHAGTLILTPHLKEFSRMTGNSMEEILASPVSLAEEYAREVKAVVLLKGPATVITDGERTFLTDTGCPGMATAGSGDVLSGIVTAILGWAEDPLLAAAAGAWINGRAGEIAQKKTNAWSMTAGDTAAAVPEALAEIL